MASCKGLYFLNSKLDNRHLIEYEPIVKVAYVENFVSVVLMEVMTIPRLANVRVVPFAMAVYNEHPKRSLNTLRIAHVNNSTNNNRNRVRIVLKRLRRKMKQLMSKALVMRRQMGRLI